MAAHYEQLKRMREKADRLKERAKFADSPRMAHKYLRQAENVLASIDAIEQNWREFGEQARGNTNFKGAQHTPEARAEMSMIRKAFWASKAGREKMWRARKKRQYREDGGCRFRFPRLSSSVDKEWLKAYCARYKRVIGRRPEIRLY
jgi:hypothetical protein